LNNEEQDLDDIPTEEEELNLANILQATENTRTQTFRKLRYSDEAIGKNPMQGLSIICSGFIGLVIIFIGIAIILNAIIGNSSNPMNDFIAGFICIISGGLALYLTYLGVLGKATYTKDFS